MSEEGPTHSIIETKAFTRRVKELGLSAGELASIYDCYAKSPDYGVVVRRTGGLRKGRVAKDGKGKSGSYRVFSFFLDEDDPVFLLWLIDKSDEENLSEAQENAFKTLTAALRKELKK